MAREDGGFSILERIVGVETPRCVRRAVHCRAVSVSSNGSLGLKLGHRDVARDGREIVSVSSNGSLGLKQRAAGKLALLVFTFQYPRTDRWG